MFLFLHIKPVHIQWNLRSMKHVFENANISNEGDYALGKPEGDGDGSSHPSRNKMTSMDATQSLEWAITICLALRCVVLISLFNQYRECI